MSWEEVELHQITNYRKGKINSDKLNQFNYVSTDCMLSDKQGITEAVSLPENGNFNIFYENDILISNIRPYFKKIWMATKNGGCSNDVLVFPTDNNKIMPRYLFYILSNDEFFDFMMAGSNGTKMPRGSKDAILKYKFKLPHLKIQGKIVNLISNYDNLIENNNTRIKLLENMAEELYKEWFVRLRFPNYQNTKIVDGIPSGWGRGNLDKYLKFFRGKSYSSEDIASDEGLPFVNLKCINRNGGFRRDGLKVFSGKYQDANIAYSGDIIMAVTDMTQDRAIVGRVGRIPKMTYQKFIFSMDTIRIEPIKIEKVFLYILLRFSDIGLYLKEFANGVNVLHLTPDIIYKVNTLMPDYRIQIEFTNIVKPILDEIDILQLKNQNLKETRDLLLPRLISGKLDIKDMNIV